MFIVLYSYDNLIFLVIMITYIEFKTISYLIFQYLDFSGFDRTLASFMDECNAKDKPISASDSPAIGNEKIIMVQVNSLTLINNLFKKYIFISNIFYLVFNFFLYNTLYYTDLPFIPIFWYLPIFRTYYYYG